MAYKQVEFKLLALKKKEKKEGGETAFSYDLRRYLCIGARQ
jgi:hypothetical protein